MLKKRAAEVSSANDEEINWDDVADLAGNSNSGTNAAKDIPDDVQDKLLSEYEKELIEAKVKKVDQNLKTQLKIKDKQTSQDKGEFKLGPRVVALGQKGATAILKEFSKTEEEIQGEECSEKGSSASILEGIFNSPWEILESVLTDD